MDKLTATPKAAPINPKDPATVYAQLERRAARKGYTLTRTPVVGFMLKRGTVSKHFGRMETGFQLLREPTCSD